NDDLSTLDGTLRNVRDITGSAARVTSLLEQVVSWPLQKVLALAGALARFARDVRGIRVPAPGPGAPKGGARPNGALTRGERGWRRALDPQGPITFLVLRPVSDLFLWVWWLERRLEFLYRPQFDRWLRPPIFEF